MRKNLFVRPALAFVLAACGLAANAFAQDFQRSYPLGAGGEILVSNVSGDVKVTGYDGEAVSVVATKVGRDREMVEVVDESAGDRVKLGVRYPRNCNCDASVNFEVRVPRGASYRVGPVSTASGNVEVSGVSGDVQVSTASGNVTVRDVAGSVKASSASGDVRGELTRFDAARRLVLSTASGNVTARMPDNADASVSLSTASGSVKTDFPIEVERSPYGTGQRASGRLGNGTASVKLSSASGNVSLTRL